jgi:hypothetical protein
MALLMQSRVKREPGFEVLQLISSLYTRNSLEELRKTMNFSEMRDLRFSRL